MATSAAAKRRVDLAGGTGSILTALLCAYIGWTDFSEERAWHIWALMTVVLILNGIAMFYHAHKLRQELSSCGSDVGQVIKLRT